MAKRQFVNIGSLNQDKERDEEYTKMFIDSLSTLGSIMKIKYDDKEPEVSSIKFIGEGRPLQFEELKKLFERFPNSTVLPNGNVTKFTVPYSSIKNRPMMKIERRETDKFSFVILMIGLGALFFYGYRFMAIYDPLRSFKFQ